MPTIPPVLLGPPEIDDSQSTSVKVDLAHNKIVVNVAAHDPVGVVDRTGLVYYLELWVPESYLSGTFVRLDTLEGREVPKSVVGGTVVFQGAFFEIDSLLRGMLESTVPSFEQASISVCPDLIRPYYCKAIVKNNEVTVSTEVFTSRYAMKSGIAESDYEAYGGVFFDKYIGDGKRFLTYKPNRSKVKWNQPEYLYFLTNYTKQITELKLKVRVKDLEGKCLEKESLKLSGVNSMQVYCVPVGMKALGISDAMEYSVWLLDQNDDVISEVRTYVVEQRYKRYEKVFLFENSLGVFDCFVSNQASSVSKKVSKQLGSQFVGYDYAASASETVVTERMAAKEMVVSFDWSNGRVANYLTDFLYSRRIFLQTDRSLLAMDCVSDAIATREKENYQGISMTLRYGQNESNFSDLPVLTGIVARETGWRAVTSACQLDQRGRRNGLTTVLTLEKYYLDDNSLYLPRTLKPNIVGEEGYLVPAVSSSCGFSSTPFLSAEINRQGTYVRQNCGDALVGGFATIVIAAGAWGSTISQADANAKAEAEWQGKNTQAYANVNGTCSAFPWAYVIGGGGVPVGRFWVRYQTSSASATNNSGVYSGASPYRPGNMWFCQPAYQADQTDVVAPNVWDVSYPVRTEWTFFVYNNNVPRVWKYYINGVLKQTVAITGVNTSINLVVLPVSGDRVFFLIE